MFEVEPDEVESIAVFISNIGAEEGNAATPGSRWKQWIPHFFVVVTVLSIVVAIIAVIIGALSN